VCLEIGRPSACLVALPELLGSEPNELGSVSLDQRTERLHREGVDLVSGVVAVAAAPHDQLVALRVVGRAAPRADDGGDGSGGRHGVRLHGIEPRAGDLVPLLRPEVRDVGLGIPGRRRADHGRRGTAAAAVLFHGHRDGDPVADVIDIREDRERVLALLDVLDIERPLERRGRVLEDHGVIDLEANDLEILACGLERRGLRERRSVRRNDELRFGRRRRGAERLAAGKNDHHKKRHCDRAMKTQHAAHTTLVFGLPVPPDRSDHRTRFES
jgi:hypothetical protein